MIFSCRSYMGEYRDVTGDWWFASSFNADHDIIVSY